MQTIAKYKGNRDKMEKPAHYQAVRDYFINDWDAEVVEGIEADDEVSISAWEVFRNSPDEYCIATIDKDLDQIPGWHYDYKKPRFFTRLMRWMGNCSSSRKSSAETRPINIKGCYRIGLAKAKKLVEEWFESYAEDQKLANSSLETS